MKEVKTPKKPLVYYGLIVLAVLLLFNMLITPMIAQRQVVEAARRLEPAVVYRLKGGEC